MNELAGAHCFDGRIGRSTAHAKAPIARIREGSPSALLRRQDRAFIYRPTQAKNQVIGGMIREFIDRVFNGSTEPLLVHLVKTRHIREKELQKLARMIEESE